MAVAHTSASSHLCVPEPVPAELVCVKVNNGTGCSDICEKAELHCGQKTQVQDSYVQILCTKKKLKHAMIYIFIYILKKERKKNNNISLVLTI